ncbi:MAG: hypothetical protein WCF33_22345 [Pseudonocardiaceae bacterium]
MSLQVLGELLMLFLGVPLGATWTDLILHAKHRRQAEERRQLTEERLRLDEEWAAVRTARAQDPPEDD